MRLSKTKLIFEPVFSGAVKAGHQQRVGWWVHYQHSTTQAFGATKAEARRNLSALIQHNAEQLIEKSEES